MSSEEFRVSTSGPSIPFFLYEAVNRPVDFEGLLFGDYQRCLHREISDQADAGDQNRPATVIHDVHIRRIVPTGCKFSFYNRRFNADMPAFAGNVVQEMNSNSGNAKSGRSSHAPTPGRSALSSSQHGESNDETVVRSGFLGWFRYMKCPAQYNSELFICHALSSQKALNGFPMLKNEPVGDTFDLSAYYPWPGHGCFYLFAFPVSKNNILEWDVHLKVYISTTKQLRPVRMTMRNVGDTTHADYWKVGEGGAAAAGADRLLPGIVPQESSKQLVDETDRMAQNAKGQLTAAYKQAINATARMFNQFQNSQKNIPGHLPSKLTSHCVRYGYTPSVQQSSALVGYLQSSIGSKKVVNEPPPVAPEQNSSQDLFDVPNAAGETANAGSTEHDGGDSAKEDGDWQMVSSADAAATSAIVQKASSLNISDSEIDYPEMPQSGNLNNVTHRGAKRPKNNTSSSSSGANSDEMPESIAANTKNGDMSTPKLTSTMKAHATVRAPVAGQQSNTGGSVNNQQQRKKSKSSDSGGSLSGAENKEVATPVSAASHSPSSMGSQRMIRPSTPASTISNSSHGSGRGSPQPMTGPPIRPSRGRGDRMAKQINPPPGFNGQKP